MKELGEYLKETREENGVGLEEASEDLNISKDDLENIEEGNVRAFKDVLKLKIDIRNYAKYLGLDADKVADEFNDFIFEHTSKISLKDILDAEKKTRVEQEKKIQSPYTIIRKKRIDKKAFLIGLLSIGIVIMLFIIMYSITRPRKPIISKELRSNGGIIYELA